MSAGYTVHVLTIGWELYDQLIVAFLGSDVLVLDGSLVLVYKHLRTQAVSLVLLIVRVQALYHAAVLLRTHLSQLLHTKTDSINKLVFCVGLQQYSEQRHLKI